MRLCLALALVSQLILNSLAAENLELIPSARKQIQISQAEKAARGPAQRKMDSKLNHALRQRRFGAVAPGLDSLQSSVRVEPDGRLLVDLRANVTPGLLAFIEQNGGQVIHSFVRDNAIRARFPLGLMERLATRSDVHSLRPADEAITNIGPINSGGDVAHRADEVRSAYSVNGAGIKIGVLSDSVDHLGQSQAGGELPSVTILPGQAGEGSGEGTAMLEIIHDLAPGAELYFATAFNGVASFAQNIRDLHAAGCRIIVDDVIYFGESPLQDGPIAQAVNDVSAAGTLFFSSAGNGGSLLKGTSGTWEGNFKDGGAAIPPSGTAGARLHDFGGVAYNTVLPGGGFTRMDLFWADPLGASTNDYDVYVLNSLDQVVRISNNVQDGNDDPYESVPFLGVGERVVIVKNAGSEDRFLSLMTLRGRLAIATPGSVRGHNASGASNAFSVAAARVSSPPAPFDTLSSIGVESFSSDGPRRIFFHPDGTAITPGNFLATGGIVLAKPDITAADGVVTSVPGFANFLGTSAAAPHAGAIAALLWSHQPLLTPAEMRAFLALPALDIEGPGVEPNSGAGIVMADQTFAPVPRLFLRMVHLTDGNGNGGVDANECGDLIFTLENTSLPVTQVVTGITAVLTSSTPGVTVDPVPRSFPDLAPGNSATNQEVFRISTSQLFDCGTNANFVLHVSTSNQISFNLPFHLQPPVSGIGPPMTYTATTVPVLIPDLGTAESTVLVTNMHLLLERVRVAVHLTHTYDYDLRLSLVSPDGTEVLLSSANGGAGQDYGVSCDSMTVFSDDAVTRITDGTAPFLGTFRPQQPLAAFQGKSGSAVNGHWTLRVQDQAAQDSGILHCWSLELSPLACADGGGQCLVAPTIVQGPISQVATEGDTVQFNVQVQGTAPLHYQWFFIPSSNVVANSLPVATNSTLTLSNVTPANAGAYSVLVTNLYGQQLSPSATLTVQPPPILLCGTNRTLELGASWNFDEPQTIGDEITVNVLSTVTNVGCGDGYRATRTWLASNTNGIEQSCSQTITVLDARTPTIVCAPDKTVLLGAAWAFDVPTATAAGAVASIVYDNSVNDLLLRFDPGTIEVGDEIILNGPAEQVAQFAFEFWGTATNVGGFEGEVEARLRFYKNDGPLSSSGYASPGTVLFDSGPFSIPATPRATVVFEDFQIDALVPLVVPLPGAFTWTVQFSGLGSGDSAGVDLYSPPVAGTNYTDYWEREGGVWIQKTNAVGSIDFAARLEGLSRGVIMTEMGTVTNAPVGNKTEITRTWRAADECGNHATCSQTVTVEDTRPPLIAGHPLSQIVISGEGVAFNVTATGAAPLSYQWYFNESNLLATATGPALVLTNAQVTNAGLYFVTVSNSFGMVTSAVATLTVWEPPTITLQPVSLAVEAGQNISFHLTATGTEPLAYQWFFNGTPISGATESAISVENVQTTNAGRYAAVVTNVAGAITSQVAILFVGFPPLLCGTDRVVELGTPWSFDAPLTFGEDITVNVLATATNAGCGDGYMAMRTWTATDTNGLQALCSQTITVLDTRPPTIICAPDKTVPLGADWAFDAPVGRAAGAVASTVYDNSVNDLLLRFDPGTLEVGDEIILNGVAEHLGLFAFEFWGFGPAGGEFEGDVHAQVRFYLNDGPQSSSGYPAPGTLLFDSGLFPIPATPRATVVFEEFQLDALVPLVAPLTNAFTWTVQFSGLATNDRAGLDLYSPPVVGQNYSDYWERESGVWLMKTNPVAPMNFAASLEALSRGVTVTELATVTNAPVGNTTAITRTWQATDECGNGATCSQTVTIADTRPPLIVDHPQSLTVNEGEDVVFAVTAMGAATLSYQWLFNGTHLLVNATEASLVLTNVHATNNGLYSVVVSNAFGTATSAVATLNVFSAPWIVLQPEDQNVSPGDAASFTVSVAAYPLPSYQWLFNETNLLADATNSTLNLTNVQSEHVGLYSVVVTNSLGVVTSRLAGLTLGVPAFISAQPQNLALIPGQTALFTVGAGGTPPLAFQWYFNCTNALTDATAATLVLTNVTAADSGSYCVSVSNAFGSVLSLPARLSVLSPPDFFTITRTGTVVTLTFSTLANQFYTVQFRDVLDASAWSALRKGSNRPGTGLPMVLQDPEATVPQRFYRILIE